MAGPKDLDPNAVDWTTCEVGQCRGEAVWKGRCIGHLTKSEMQAAVERMVKVAQFDLRGCTITGQVAAELTQGFQRCTERATVRLDGSHWGGDLVLSAARLGNMSFDRANLAGHLTMFDTEVLGDLSMGGASLGGSAHLSGAKVAGKLSLEGTTVHDEAVLFGAVVKGGVSLLGAAVAGGLTMAKAELGGLVTLVDAQVADDVSLRGAQLGRDLMFGDLKIDGDLSLSEAEVQGDVFGFKAHVSGDVSARAARVEGSLSLFGGALGGDVSIFDAEIAGDFSMAQASVVGNVHAFDATFGGDVSLAQAQVAGDISLARTAVTGNVILDGASWAGRRIVLRSSSAVSAAEMSLAERCSVQLDAPRIDLESASFLDGGTIGIQAGSVDLSSVMVGGPLAVTDLEGAGPASDGERLIGWLMSTWSGRPATVLAGPPAVSSLERARLDAEIVIEPAVSMSAGRLTGAHNLDRLAVRDPRGQFDHRSVTALKTRRFGDRQVIASEHLARWYMASPGWDRPRQLANPGTRTLPPGPTPVVLSNTYRALRQGMEADGNAAAAGGFYYGEMEWRRLDPEPGVRGAVRGMALLACLRVRAQAAARRDLLARCRGRGGVDVQHPRIHQPSGRAVGGGGLARAGRDSRRLVHHNGRARGTHRRRRHHPRAPPIHLTRPHSPSRTSHKRKSRKELTRIMTDELENGSPAQEDRDRRRRQSLGFSVALGFSIIIIVAAGIPSRWVSLTALSAASLLMGVGVYYFSRLADPSAEGEAASAQVQMRELRSRITRIEERDHEPSTGAEARLPEDAFSEIAAFQGRAANRYRFAAIGTALASFGGAVAWVVVAVDDDLDSALRKLAIGLPVALLFTYLVRESNSHRANQLWALRTAAQVQSVRAYADDLLDRAGPAANVVEHLGLAVYSGADADLISKRSQKAASGPVDDLQGLLQQIERIVGASRPAGNG